MTAVLPTDLRYGTVRWQVVGAAEDSNDPGSEPDSETVTGTVTFRPVVDFVKFLGTAVDPQPKTVLPRPYTYDIVGGILKDKSGNPNVRLVACDSPSTSPQDWQYLAEYQLDDGYTFGSFRFKLHDGEVVDLTRQVPEEAVDGTIYVTGPAGTVAIGTVTTGAPGSQAAVTNSGTPTEAELDFTIPRGDVGATGPAGTITGATASGLAAGAAPTVALGGTASARTLAFGIPKGDKGDKGDVGNTGPAGTITDATAAGLAAGAAPTVTLGGTASARTFAFGIPKGDKGDKGDQGDQGLPGAGAPDATATTKGSVQLAGHIGGTAAAPTVVSGAGHGHTVGQISDSTTVGRSVVTALDAAAARAAIGAGTSNLALGITSTTAKAGNYQPVAANISDLAEAVQDIVGAQIIAGPNITVAYDDATGKITVTSSGGGGGGTNVVPATIFVAASTASAAEKTLAGPTYTCDGTADDVQIQAAINAIKAAGGGWVLLSAGDFNLAARLTISGNSDENQRQHIGLRGAGDFATRLRPASGLASAIHLTNCVTASVHDFAIYVNGNTTGITSAADHVNAAASHKSFWMSSFKNIEVWGDFAGTGTGWGLDLDSPFRTVFENIDVTGTRNGVRLYSSHDAFNPGNSVFNRCFMSIFGSNGFAWKLESTVANGKLNILEFLMCEGIAFNGTGNTGVWVGGVGPVNNTRWRSANLEQFDTVFHVQRGEDNVMDGDYWDVRNGAAANTTAFIRFDANAWNNRVSIGNAFTRVATRLVLSTATSTTMPNLVEHVKMIVDTGGAVTNSIATPASVVSRWIVGEGANIGSASTVLVSSAAGQYAINAKDFGAVGNDSADDTAALDAAVAFAVLWKLPLYVPEGTYRRTTPWDLRAHGLHVFGESRDVASGNATIIKQMTANTPVIRLGRWHQNISDLVATYAVAPTSAHTSAIGFEFYKAYWGTYSRLFAHKVGRGFDIAQVNYDDGFSSTANGVFSCEFSSCRVTGFAINAIRFNNFGGGGTGNVWTNTYISNNPDGIRLSSSGCIVEMKVADETVFNQLNIEWGLIQAAQPSSAMYFESGGNITINSLHLEQLSLETNGEAFFLVSDGNKVTVNGLCLSNNQVTNNGTHALARFFSDSWLTINGIDAHDNTVAGTFVLANVASGTAGVSSVRVNDAETAVFTALVSGEKASPQQILREVNGNRYRWQQNGKNHTTGTAAPTSGTWAVGDTVWNTAPAAGGAPGWMCVAAGTPGTWKAMAALAA